MTTLKAIIDAGWVRYASNAKGDTVASIYRADPSYVLVGITGRQELAINVTDAARLQAHWDGFSAACIERGNSKE